MQVYFSGCVTVTDSLEFRNETWTIFILLVDSAILAIFK